MTHNGIPEEKKRRMRKREQKLETPLWCSVFFLIKEVFIRRVLANFKF
jgi:hypothetical protein